MVTKCSLPTVVASRSLAVGQRKRSVQFSKPVLERASPRCFGFAHSLKKWYNSESKGLSGSEREKGPGEAELRDVDGIAALKTPFNLRIWTEIVFSEWTIMRQ